MLKRENRILTGLSFLHTALLFSGFYFLPVCFLQMEKETAAGYVWRFLWLLIPAAASWWSIRKIKGLFPYLLILAGCTGVIWLLTRCYLTAALSAVIFLIRCYVRIKKGKIKKMMQEMPGETGARMDRELWEIPTLLDCPKVVHWILFCAIYLVSIAAKRYELLRWVFWLLLAELVICFIYNYVERMTSFIKEKQHIANLPGRAVRRISWFVFGTGMLLLAVFVLPAVLYDDEPLTRIHFEPAEISSSPEELTEQQDGGGLEEMMKGLAGEAQEPPKWMLFLSEMMQYILLAAIGIGAVVGICIVCRRALQSFAEGAQEEDEVIFLGEDTQEDLRTGDGGRRVSERWNSPNKKIRRKYRKIILRSRKQRPGGWESPAELELGADLSRIADEHKFHILYEKARYSQEGCTQEEAGEYGR